MTGMTPDTEGGGSSSNKCDSIDLSGSLDELETVDPGADGEVDVKSSANIEKPMNGQCSAASASKGATRTSDGDGKDKDMEHRAEIRGMAFKRTTVRSEASAMRAEANSVVSKEGRQYAMAAKRAVAEFGPASNETAEQLFQGGVQQ